MCCETSFICVQNGCPKQQHLKVCLPEFENKKTTCIKQMSQIYSENLKPPFSADRNTPNCKHDREKKYLKAHHIGKTH